MKEQSTLDALNQAVSGAESDAAEIVAIESHQALTRFADSVIHQNVAESDWTLYARAVNGLRSGVAVGNDPSPAALRRLLTGAHRLSLEQPEEPDFPGLAAPSPVVNVDAHFASTAEATPSLRADKVAAVVDRLSRDGLRASGACASGEGTVTIVNSLGVGVSQPLTAASLRVVALSDQGMGLCEVTDRDIRRVDSEDTADRAASIALMNRDPRPLAEGVYRALLMPPCMHDVLGWLGFTAFGSRAWLDGTGFPARALGQRLLDPAVTLRDDPFEDDALGLPFDFEGTPRRALDLVRDGVNHGVCLDPLSARQAGMPPTGHAPPPDSPRGGAPSNLVMAPGDVPDDELLQRLGTGILVHRFHYVNGFLDPRRALMTGMTRYGTFWVEDGTVRHALKNLRWTQSFTAALGEDLVAVGSERAVAVGRGGSTCVAPAVLVENFHVTGATG